LIHRLLGRVRGETGGTQNQSQKKETFAHEDFLSIKNEPPQKQKGRDEVKGILSTRDDESLTKKRRRQRETTSPPPPQIRKNQQKVMRIR
jgi:hypothetical protein